MEGIWVDWTQLLLIGSAIAYPFAPEEWKQVAFYAIIASLVIVIWGKGYGSVWYMRPVYGFLGLLNLAMGMMSNVLSYLRLLALGLVTGALALAVNLVAQQIGGFLPPFLGIPLSIVIYVAGHTVNIALNVLGAFIHSGRLQFVEFFSQFFEGGGRPFNPFKRRHS
jgi:V/A-type H+-transporting ATPase subunit I